MNSSTPGRKRSNNLPGDCLPRKESFRTHEAIVQDYIDHRRRGAREGLKYFADQPNLSTAICVAALAINKNGKRHSHQRRIPGPMLEHFRRGLLRRRESLRSCKTFPDLLKISEKVAAGIWKNSQLTIYDTTHRIGAYLGVQPDRVYLHAGTREGAKALGVGGLPFVFPSELPKAFRRLEAYEIEDCLCIYKKKLRSLGSN